MDARESKNGDAPDFVEVGEAGITVDMLCGVNVRFNVLGDVNTTDAAHGRHYVLD